MELVGFSNHYLLTRRNGSGGRMDLKNAEADRAPGYVEETLESAGCTGGCPTYPGAPMSDDGMPDCSKCPQFTKESMDQEQEKDDN